MSKALCSLLLAVVSEQEKQWQKTITTLIAQRYPRIELLLASTSNHTPPALAANHFEKTRLFQATSLPSALNLASAAATGHYLCFTRTGGQYPPSYIEQLLTALANANGQAAFAKPLSQASWQPLRYTLEHEITRLPSLSFGLLMHDFTAGGHFAVTRKHFQDIGPLAENAHYYGWEWLLRSTTQAEPIYAQPTHYSAPEDEIKVEKKLQEAHRQFCLARYFQQIVVNPTFNKQAPSPKNWPGVFEYYVQNLGLASLWTRTAYGSVAGGRTVDF